MIKFRNVLFMLVLVSILVGGLTGCQVARGGLAKHYVNKSAKKAEEQRVEWFSNSDNRNFIQELEDNGLKNVEFVAKGVEGILYRIVFEPGEDKDALAKVFYKVDAQEWPSAKDAFLGFINSPDLMKLVIAKWETLELYAEYTPEEMEILTGAVYQHYQNKIMNERDEAYAQGRINLVDVYLEEGM